MSMTIKPRIIASDFICPAINADQAAEIARQIKRGEPNMTRLLAAEVPPAIAIPFHSDLLFATTTYGRGAAKAGQWRSMGLPESVATALADGINGVADRTR